MAYPDKPQIQTSYTAVQQAQGNGLLPGQQLDVDFANLKATVSELNDFVRGITRSDGRLANASVSRVTLGADILLGFEPPQLWQTGQSYAPPETVFEDAVFYLCAIPHTAGASFADDLAAGRWEAIADFGALADAAADSRDAAVVAQLAAEAARDEAEDALGDLLASEVGKRVGEPFALWDHFSGVSAPDNSGAAKYIRLTAGQAGSGGYNEGLLTDEQVVGSAPLLEASAEIAIGPLAGQRVPLVNSEGSVVLPGTSSGTLQLDQMQRITGNLRQRRTNSSETNPAAVADNGLPSGVVPGALSEFDDPAATALGAVDTGTARGARRVQFDSADSPNARTGDHTRPKNRQATFYMRIV